MSTEQTAVTYAADPAKFGLAVERLLEARTPPIQAFFEWQDWFNVPLPDGTSLAIGTINGVWDADRVAKNGEALSAVEVTPLLTTATAEEVAAFIAEVYDRQTNAVPWAGASDELELLLAQGAALMPLGTAKRGKWLTRVAQVLSRLRLERGRAESRRIRAEIKAQNLKP